MQWCNSASEMWQSVARAVFLGVLRLHLQVACLLLLLPSLPHRLLEVLDAKKAELCIAHCSISAPTLEEVFLTLTTAAETEDNGTKSTRKAVPCRATHQLTPHRSKEPTAAVELSSRNGQPEGSRAIFTITNGVNSSAAGSATVLAPCSSATTVRTGGHAGQPAIGAHKWEALLVPAEDASAEGPISGLAKSVVTSWDGGNAAVGHSSLHVASAGLPAGGGKGAGSTFHWWAHAWRCFRVMVAKRALIASRDLKVGVPMILSLTHTLCCLRGSSLVSHCSS
jgi:hypothetical protein